MLDGVYNSDKNKENIANDIAKIQRLIDNKTSKPLNIKESLYQNQKEEKSNLIVEGTYKKIPFDEKYNFENFEPFLVNKTPFIIGTGTFSDVFLYKNKIDSKFYAMKKMDKNKILELNANLIIAQKEIDIQSKINHPNILRLYNSRELIDHYDLILEYAQEGNLYQTIKKEKKGFSEDITFKYFIQALNAIYFLHENNIIHRDIKPENFLLMNKDLIKLCDFGWSTEIEIGNRTTFCGTFEYMAPEIINDEPYEKGVDVWALGVLLYELFYGFTPFQPSDNSVDKVNDILCKVLKNDIQFNNNQKVIDDDMKDLILKMCESNMKKRISLKNVFQHPWIKKFEFQLYGNKISLGNKENVNFRKIDIPKMRISEGSNLKDKDDETFFDNVLKKAKNKKRKRGRIYKDKSRDVSMDKSSENKVFSDINEDKYISQKDIRRINREKSVNIKNNSFTLNMNNNKNNTKKNKENNKNDNNTNNNNNNKIENNENLIIENNRNKINNKDIDLEIIKINKTNTNIIFPSDKKKELQKEKNKDIQKCKTINTNVNDFICKDINHKKTKSNIKINENIKTIITDINQLNISEIEKNEINTPNKGNQSPIYFTEINKQLTQEKDKLKNKKLSNEQENKIHSSKTTESSKERNSDDNKIISREITANTFNDVLNLIEKSKRVEEEIIKGPGKKKKANLIHPRGSFLDILFKNFKCD